MVSAPKSTIRMARKLRRDMSLPEVLLWRILRERPGGNKFRKQHPIGSYVLDFYCLEARLAIEIDGIVHDMGDQAERDPIRDAWLGARGIKTIRIPARDVLANAAEVARWIVVLISSRSS